MRRRRTRWLVHIVIVGAVPSLLAAGTHLHAADRSGACRLEASTGPGASSGTGGDKGARRRGDNEARSLVIEVTESGVRVSGARPGRPAWDLGLSLTRFGHPEDLRSTDPAFLRSGGDRVELLRGVLDEWFRDGPTGIEHGLEVRGPRGASLLWFEFSITGTLTPKVSEDGQKIFFRDHSGAPSLIELDLAARDADGREAAARWERVEPAEPGHVILRLVLQAADHAFPLRVRGRLATPKGARRASPAPTPRLLTSVAAAPSNDLCSAAEVIPGNGPFPYLTPAEDLTDATTMGDPPAPSCQPDVSRSVWFEFTPAETAFYDLTVCSDAPTSTTLEDTVLAVYAASGACAGLTELTGGCNDDWCGPSALQSEVTGLHLTAGATYYIVAWSFGTTVPEPGAGTLQLQVTRRAPPGPAPSNDLCADAEVIPGTGPFPYLTSITADIGGASTASDPPLPSCQTNVSRSIWYSFTPVTDGRYAFSLCADAPTGTTVDDTVLAVYQAAAVCSGLMEVPGGCNDDSCGTEAAQSVIAGVNLTGGTTYYVVAWEYGLADPTAGNTAVQLLVTQVTSPPNDTCAGAETLSLETPVGGTTISAADDMELPSGSTCFSGIGQTPSTAPGTDVAYRFTAPLDGAYSFRLSGYDSSKNAVLYVSSDCPSGTGPTLVAGCLGAANRNVTAAEEVACLPLLAGQQVYVHVDEASLTSGSGFTLEASRCESEVEPNGDPASAEAAVCDVEGSIMPFGDVDFYALGIPSAGSRLFALADGAAGNSTDFDMRLTTGSDTLEYDDFNNDIPFGTVSPNISGAPLTGGPSFLRVNHYSPVGEAEPYRLYASIRPPASAASQEIEPNDTISNATSAPSEYYAGSLSSASDVDLFAFSAVAGDLVQIGLDLDPGRNGTPFNGTLTLLDDSGMTLLKVSDPSGNSSTLSGSGSLGSSTPFSPGEAMVYKARAGGIYYARVTYSSGTPGDYLLSIAHDCRVNPPADLAVVQSGEPDPVAPGGTVTYTIVVTNLGPQSASVVTLRDELPPGATYVSAIPDQGVCAGSGPVVCHLGDLAAGGSATLSVVITAPPGPGPLVNVASVSSATVDPSAANDVSVMTTTSLASDSDGDGVADVDDCAPTDPSAWAVPGEATGLRFSTISPDDLEWSAPSQPGAAVVTYDLLRSTIVDGFLSPTCLVVDTASTTAGDPAIPGAVFYYLVRAKNACGGNVGIRSDGIPRTAGSCP